VSLAPFKKGLKGKAVQRVPDYFAPYAAGALHSDHLTKVAHFQVHNHVGNY